MEYTNVKNVSDTEEKSVQEVEGELLKKHEEQFSDEPTSVEATPVDETKVNQEEQPPKLEMNEEDVLSFMRNRYGKEINSLDDLTAAREDNQELPEDVAAYYKYKKETGRGIEDFVRLNKDFDSQDPNKLLKDYLTATEKGLDEEDIESMLEDYSYDEDLDDETTIRKRRLLKKKTIAKAKEYFESEKEKYGTPLESSGASISDEDQKELNDYKQYVKEATSQEEEVKRKTDWYTQKTKEVFGSEFKGFEFAIDEDRKVNFSPGDTNELLNIHSTPANFVSKYLDDDGLLKDSVGYHRALAVAMNPDKFAKFFYEQGKSIGTDDVMQQTKNVNMSTRSAPEFSSKGGTQVRAVNPDSGRSLKIRSNKKN
tara:strand:- start:598 stop:1704 length:1107 start_codon:yes stop_codon:yes gene_type:complete